MPFQKTRRKAGFLVCYTALPMVKKEKVSPIEKLTKIVEKGLASSEQRFATIEKTMEKGFTAVAEDMSKLATKEGVIQLGKQLYSIEQELKDIKRRLTTLEDELGSANKRYKQEIEELWKHVAAIEKRLKMQR